MEDELFVFTEDFLEIGAVGVDPEFDHAARGVKTAGDVAALALAHVADIDDDDVRVVHFGDQIGGFDLFDPRARFRDHFGGGFFQFRHGSGSASWNIARSLVAKRRAMQLRQRAEASTPTRPPRSRLGRRRLRRGGVRLLPIIY